MQRRPPPAGCAPGVLPTPRNPGPAVLRAAEVTRPPEGEPLWTVEEACAYFAAAGLPIRPERLRKIIQGLEWQPAGKQPSGEKGGQGKALYRSSDMMILQARLAQFVAERGITRRRNGG